MRLILLAFMLSAPIFGQIMSGKMQRTSNPPCTACYTLTPQQYAAQGLGVFFSWGMTTYLGVDIDWTGPDANAWNPGGVPDFNTWMDTAVAGGAKYAILVAQHYDGFSLWPTRVTVPGYPPYSIASTIWYARNGNPDLVGMFLGAARSHGLKVGLYYNMYDAQWVDRTGLNSVSAPAAYSTWSLSKIKELLTNYGPINVLWVDQWATVPNDIAAVPYATMYAFVKSIQPNCLLINNSGGALHPYAYTEVETWEQVVPTNVGVYEMSATISNREYGWWFYDSTCTVKTAAALAATRAAANAKGASFLLDFGVAPDGSLPTCQVTAFLGMAALQ